MVKSAAAASPLITTEDGRQVTIDSLGYIAYAKDGAWHGVCEPFPSLVTEPREKGTDALNTIKILVANELTRQSS
jgi:hypothetical protein